MAIKEIHVPDIGDYQDVDVIEVNVSVGDTIKEEDSLITLETDKASMEVPAPFSGTIKEVLVKVGDKVSEGSLIVKLESSSSETQQQINKEPEKETKKTTTSTSNIIEVKVPDIGDYQGVDVIEVNISSGDEIKEEDSLITLETDKASMEVPAPFSGKIKDVKVNLGDKVSEGDVILTLETSAQIATEEAPKAAKPEETATVKPSQASKPSEPQKTTALPPVVNTNIYAGPAVRRLARILGIDLSRVPATGNKGRITKEDCYNYVKNSLNQVQSGQIQSSGSSLDLLADPVVDFAKYGDIETQPLSRINKLSAKNLHRNWVKIPHVTFWDDADITELENFRKAKKAVAEKAGVKITPVAFLVKAAAKALQAFPRMNSSLSADGENLVLKKYFHIGVAVDTPNGLLVPIVRDADKKGIFEIAENLMDIIKRGREGKLRPDDMKGATFSISSLGILGTTGFTPIINMPEVAILGVSKSQMKPVYNGKDGFEPRLTLPLSLSVDHRVIDGALAAQFLTYFCEILKDLREIIL
ncbi:dihydrolipoyllysine-residue acetyltransferase [Thiotrichales bacterium 19S3-7]|nr:dihydrolipoyllysine-residue acetyltransferase [Thiotrichales bacterium 19S3-7]MCF6802693.1 dihydrolipoyllysine-residue acetyltransferase [Thiotrichales bacterium 19S3-11]